MRVVDVMCCVVEGHYGADCVGDDDVVIVIV